jgi:5-methylcytosine-specific restriction endonuclease McrA
MSILPQGTKKNGGARIGSGRKRGNYDTPYTEHGRVCTGCKTWRPWANFIQKRAGGYWPRCKNCFKQYREANKSKFSDWRRNNPDKVRANGNNYRASKAGNGGKYTAKEWRLLCRWFGNVCVACGNKAPLAADHVVPVSKGGTSFISNIQPLCQPCNSRKATTDIDYRDPDVLHWFLEAIR